MQWVRKAAQQAQVAYFIESHRQGYETRVGERGIHLFCGQRQRQRIGIARALYKKYAYVLVFNETSSALDTKTEATVMQTVAQLNPNLIVLIIAHRVQTLRECKLFIRLDGGQLVGKGSYAEVVGDEALLAATDLQT